MKATFEHPATGLHAYVTLEAGTVTVEVPTLMGTATRTLVGSHEEAILEMANLVRNQYKLLDLTLS